MTCSPFVAPGLTAPDAPVVWLPDVEHAAIAANAQITTDVLLRDFVVTALRIRTHIHFDGHGRQIVTIENENYRATLIIGGAVLTLGAVHLRIGHISISELAGHVSRINGLAHLLINQRFMGPQRRPSPGDAKHLRNAIIALDGEQVGVSRREIATVIYGHKTVVGEWSEPSGRLKAMVKRDVLRGRRLVEGGWRDLITAGTFKAEA
ncbi:MAG: DUF2285 domain-containing protein [Hyphomicrobiaceae bacterium]|nr:DUF2285 domain-containing protein [Hyphomicrobiaceae bacterium]